MLLSKVFYRNLLVFFLLALSSACVIGQESNVCVTKTGNKYHRCSCHYLRSSSIEISLEQAKENGYTACSVCRPSSALSGASRQPVRTPLHGDSTMRKTEQPYRPVERSTSSAQCRATTKAGSRCKRMTTESNGRCWQHQ